MLVLDKLRWTVTTVRFAKQNLSLSPPTKLLLSLNHASAATVKSREKETPDTPAKFDDVRMRGFRTRRSVDETLKWVDASAQVTASNLPPESVPLSAAIGRVLVTDLKSEINVPAFARAMMDGYALHAVDTMGATTYNPLPLAIIGSVLPGQTFDGVVQRGQCVSIMTGSPMPAGADAVLPAEKVSRNGDRLEVHDEVSPAKHVGSIGEDISSGEFVLRSGRRLRPQDLGVISSLGQSHVQVVRSPRVRLLITGNELCESGTAPQPNQTVDANSPMLSALIERDGGTLLFDGITPDSPEHIQATMEDTDADIVIVSGGSSVGEEDHAPRILSEVGELAIHGIAMRPSSPTGMGRIGERLVFLLPGNPVSCLCAYDFFAARAIRLRAGRDATWPYPKHVGKLTRKIASLVGRQDYARVLVRELETNQPEIEPIAIAGASVLSSTSRANGFVVVPTDSEGYPPGAEIDFFLYDRP